MRSKALEREIKWLREEAEVLDLGWRGGNKGKRKGEGEGEIVREKGMV